MSMREVLARYGNMVKCEFDITGGTTPEHYDSSLITSFTPHYNGDICRSVMKCLDIEIDTTDKPTGDRVENAVFSAKMPLDATWQSKEYGTYIIKYINSNEENNGLVLECYDLMLESMIPYDLTLDYESGVTVIDLLDAICERLGWAKGYTTFVNANVSIAEEKFTAEDTFRTVLDEIALVSASTITFVNDELCVLYPSAVSQGDISVDCSNLSELEVGEIYGPVNSVVIFSADEDTKTTREDSESIENNGLHEIHIENSVLCGSSPESFIDGIFEQLNGFTYCRYSLSSFGIADLELLDRFYISDMQNTTHEALMLNDELVISQGVVETASATEPSISVGSYIAESATGRRIRRAEIKIDEQDLKITAVVEETKQAASELEESLNSTIEETSTSIKTEVSEQYYTKDESNELLGEISSSLEQTKDGFIMRFDGIDGDISQLSQDTKDEFAKWSGYIQFDGATITLGRDDSPFICQIRNDRISFLEDGTEVAWITNERLHITNGEFMKQLNLGNFAFIPRDNGNLSFKKVTAEVIE